MPSNAELYGLGAGASQTRKPKEVIQDFFRERSIEDLKEILGDILFVVLTRDSLQFESGLQRDAAIHTIRQLIDLAAAAKQLANGKG